MKEPRNPNRETFLWAGLLMALATGGFVLFQSGRKPVPSDPPPRQADVVRDSGSRDLTVSTAKRSRLVLTRFCSPHPIPVEAGPNMDVPQDRCETPSPEPNLLRPPEPTTDRTPAQLCSELANALADGKGRDVSAIRAKLLELGPAAVPSLSALLHTGHPSAEVEAVRLLVQIGGEQALAAALDKLLILSRTDPAYGAYLAAFADCRSTEVTARLTGLLGRVQTEEARERVLAILAALRGPQVVESLAAQLAKPADDRHAEDCAEALVMSGDPSRTSALKKLLDMADLLEVQTAAAYGLASVGNAEACSILVAKASSPTSIAPVCRDALATVASSYGQETLIQTAVNPATPSDVRCSAVQALSNQRGERVRTVLANLDQGTAEPALQTAISEALAPTAGQEQGAEGTTERQERIETCF